MQNGACSKQYPNSFRKYAKQDFSPPDDISRFRAQDHGHLLTDATRAAPKREQIVDTFARKEVSSSNCCLREMPFRRELFEECLRRDAAHRAPSAFYLRFAKDDLYPFRQFATLCWVRARFVPRNLFLH